MPLRTRLLLAVAGVIVLLVAAGLLVYAFMPIDKTREQFQPAPTLFMPPR